MKKAVLGLLFLVLLAHPARAQTTPATANLTASDSGACTTAGACLVVSLNQSQASSVVQLTGTFSATLQFEGTTSVGGTFVAVNAVPVGGTTAVTSATSTGAWRIAIAGLAQVRVRCSAFTSGTVVVAITASSGSSANNTSSSGGAVSSVFTRTGAVAAQSGDYSCTQITGCNVDPPVTQSYSLNATGAQAGINLASNGVDTHQIQWRPSGTVSTCTVALDSSPDGVTWTSGGVIPNQTCTTAGSIWVTNVIANFVRVNLTVLTGGGTVNVIYSGRLANTGPNSISGNELYVNAGEAIFGNTSGSNMTNVPFTLVVRFHPINGPVQVLSSGPTNISATGAVMAQATPTLYVAFPEAGFVEFADLSAGGSPLIGTGQVYAQLMLGCSNLALSGTGNISSTTFNTCSPAPMVIAGHNTNGFGNTTWPVPPAVPALAGPGYLATVTVTNPSAGNPATSTLSNLIRHQIVAATFTLTTSATVINRYGQLTLNCNGLNVTVLQSGAPQPASTTTIYSFLPGISPMTGSGNIQSLPMPATGILASNEAGNTCTLNLTASNLQAGDTITSINYRDLTWEENN